MPYKNHADKLANNRKYRDEHREELRAYHRQWFKEHWDSSEAFRQANQPKTSRQARNAHQRVYNAIKSGRLVRPTHCPSCGQETFVEAAHESYTEHLAIRWLCRPCHRRWDAEHPKDTVGDPEQRVRFSNRGDGRALS